MQSASASIKSLALVAAGAAAAAVLLLTLRKAVSPRKQRDPSKRKRPAVVIVDPISTGANLAEEVTKRGLACIRVFSRTFPPHVANAVLPGLNVRYVATVEHEDSIRETIEQLNSLSEFSIFAVMVGCETGVEVGEALTAALGFPANDPILSSARRNKFEMSERVRSFGSEHAAVIQRFELTFASLLLKISVRAVQQKRATRWAEAESFLKELKADPLKLVVKPVASSGTDNVFLCESAEQAKRAFDRILKSNNMLGLSNQAVLLQEFLHGQEYVVDTVSREGKHKVVASECFAFSKVCNRCVQQFGSTTKGA